MVLIDYINGILTITCVITGDSLQKTILIDDDDHEMYFLTENSDGTRTAKLGIHLSEDSHVISTPKGSTIIDVKYDDVFCVAGGTLPDAPCVFFRKPSHTDQFDPTKINQVIEDYSGTNAERIYVVTVTKTENFHDTCPANSYTDDLFPFAIEEGTCSIMSRSKNVQFRINAGTMSIVSNPVQYDLVTERDLISDQIPTCLLTQIRTFDWKVSDVYRYLCGIEQFILFPDSIKVVFHLPKVGVIEEKPSQLIVKMHKKEGWSYLVDGEKADTQIVSVSLGNQKKIVMIHDETGVQADNINVVYPANRVVKATKPHVSEKTQIISSALIAASFLTLSVVSALTN